MLLWVVDVKFCDKRTTLEEIPISPWKKLLYSSLVKKLKKATTIKKSKTNKPKYHPTNYPNKKHPKKHKTTKPTNFWEHDSTSEYILRKLALF